MMSAGDDGLYLTRDLHSMTMALLRFDDINGECGASLSQAARAYSSVLIISEMISRAGR